MLCITGLYTDNMWLNGIAESRKSSIDPGTFLIKQHRTRKNFHSNVYSELIYSNVVGNIPCSASLSSVMTRSPAPAARYAATSGKKSPAMTSPKYPAMPEDKASANQGCQCCAFVYLLYSAACQLIMKFGFTTVNKRGRGAVDRDIHSLVFRVHGSLRLRLTNIKWQSQIS